MISLYAVPCGPGKLERADEILPFLAQSVYVGEYGHTGLPEDYDMEGLTLIWEMQTGDARPKERPVGFWILDASDLSKIMKAHVLSLPEGWEEASEDEAEGEVRKQVDALVLKVREVVAKNAIAIAGDTPRPQVAA